MLKRSPEEQLAYLSNLIKNFKLFYIEDPFSEEDFEYTWEYFADLPELFSQAAENDRAIIFTVDQ